MADEELEQAGRRLEAAGVKQPDDPDGPVLRWLCRVAGRLTAWYARRG